MGQMGSGVTPRAPHPPAASAWELPGRAPQGQHRESPHGHRSQLQHRHGQRENPLSWEPAGRTGGPRPLAPRLCSSHVCQEPQQLQHNRTAPRWPHHPTSVLAQPWSHPICPHAEPDPAAWPRRETEAGRGGCTGGFWGWRCRDPPNGAGGRWRPQERVKREAKPLPPLHCQTAARGVGGAFCLGPKSPVGHMCDECAGSQHNRTDSSGEVQAGGANAGGMGVGEGCFSPKATLHPHTHPGADKIMLQTWKVLLLASRARAGVGGCSPGGVTPAQQVSGWGPQRAARKGRGVPSPPGLHPPAPCCGCTAAPRCLGAPFCRGGRGAAASQSAGRSPGEVTVPGSPRRQDVRGVGLLPQLFRGWNIPSGAGARAARGDAGSWQGPSARRPHGRAPRGAAAPAPRTRAGGRMQPRGPPAHFATHAAPLNIWQIGNKCNIISSVL